MSVPLPIQIRPAESGDIPALTGIYNEAILTTTATFDTEPKTIEERTQWLQSRGERYPVLVAVVESKVVGWSALTAFSDRKAYDVTAETSFYVHSAHRGRGIGRKLKDAIIAEAEKLGYHSLVVRVTEESLASVHLNEQAGFVTVGILKEVGRKFGRLLDVRIMQKMLGENPKHE